MKIFPDITFSVSCPNDASLNLVKIKIKSIYLLTLFVAKNVFLVKEKQV